MKKLFLHILLCILFTSCLTSKKFTNHQTTTQVYESQLDILEMFDSTRNRKIPVAFYSQKTAEKIQNQQIIIFSHGYGENGGGDNLRYSYLTENLASKGYFVVSIQHELPNDSLLAMTGNLQITRKPNWERGVENIVFVLNELKRIKPELDYKHLTAIGHSNGGDMTVLFAHKYPDMAYKVISLDNRRMPLPRVSQPKIYTLRSNDYPADEGVLPTPDEQLKNRITVQSININHNKMDDNATTEERQTINQYLERYLNEK